MTGRMTIRYFQIIPEIVPQGSESLFKFPQLNIYIRIREQDISILHNNQFMDFPSGRWEEYKNI